MGSDDTTSQPDKSSSPRASKGHFSPFTRRVAVALAMVIFVGVILFLFWQLITLILITFLGILFAVFLRGLTNHVTRLTPLNEHWALFTVATTMVLLFAAGGWLLAPQISDQASLIGEMIPEAIAELQNWAEGTTLGQSVLHELEELDLGEFVGGGFLGQLGGAVFGVAEVISYAVYVLFVGLYLAIDPEVYKRGILRMVPLTHRERAAEIIEVCAHQLAWWLIGRLVAMVAVGVLITVGLWILDIPLAFFLGFLAGLFSFVPILGPIVSFFPAGLVALLVGPEFVIWVALLFLGAQAIESYFITPIVQHRVVSLPHAMTLIAEIFGGILFGLIGITIATPLAVLIIALVNMIYVEDVLGDTTPFTEIAEEQTRSRAPP